MRFCKKNGQFIYMLLQCITAWSLGNSQLIPSTKVLPEWPGNSPDHNLIGNFWSQMKNMQRREHATSIEGLKRIALKVWRQVTPSYLKALYKLMLARMQAVIS